MVDSRDQRLKDISNELLGDCLKRISEGDPSAAFDLASFYIGHLADNDVEISLAVIEGLARQSATLGCSEAQRFLEDQWPSMRNIIIKRSKRV